MAEIGRCDSPAAAALDKRDIERLRELRTVFLTAEEGRGADEYWRNRRDLELYDATFAQRIGWKWDAVLAELARRGGLPRGASVLDWGCGTGIASRRYLAALGGASGVRVRLFDRSNEAASFAGEALSRGGVDAEIERREPVAAPDVLLVSHVLGELDDAALASLLALVRASAATIWVEAGSRAISRKLSASRDELARELDVVAPCTHQAACGMLAPENERGWCHGFARPPAEVFTSPFWRALSRELGLDLRALPCSFVALRRRAAAAAPREPDVARILGRPRVEKGRALLDVCDAGGVRVMTLLQRTDRALFRRLADFAGDPPIYEIEADDARVERIRHCSGESLR